MRRRRRHIDAKGVQINWNVTERLHRVRMKKRADLMRIRRKRLDWLKRSDFVVRRHHGDELNPRSARRLPQRVDRCDALPVHGNNADLRAESRETSRRVKNCVMLDRTRERRPVVPRRIESLQSPVVALRPPGGEDNLLWGRPDKSRDSFSRLAQRATRSTRKRITLRRVSVLPHKPRGHRLKRFGGKSSRRRRVRVYCSFHRILTVAAPDVTRRACTPRS